MACMCGDPACPSCGSAQGTLEPEHGEERGRRTETAIRTASALTQTVLERWCEHCQAWIECKGVTGGLEWVMRHRDGDCEGEVRAGAGK